MRIYQARLIFLLLVLVAVGVYYFVFRNQKPVPPEPEPEPPKIEFPIIVGETEAESLKFNMTDFNVIVRTGENRTTLHAKLDFVFINGQFAGEDGDYQLSAIVEVDEKDTNVYSFVLNGNDLKEFNYKPLSKKVFVETLPIQVFLKHGDSIALFCSKGAEIDKFIIKQN